MNFGRYKQHRGRVGEQLAESYLRETMGWRILERNWSCRRGEIDIIAEDHGVIVFIEVKARDSRTEHDPETAVDFGKRTRLRAAARSYLAKWDSTVPYRYDVVAVWLTPFDTAAQIELRIDAFTDENKPNPE